MTLYRLAMLFIITIEIGVMTYAFARKGKFAKTVNFFILYGTLNTIWFITQLISTSPIINDENALFILRFRAFAWNFPTLFYLFFIASLTKVRIKKTLILLFLIALFFYGYTLFSDNVINALMLVNGIYLHKSTFFSKLIPSFNMIYMLLIFVILYKKYDKDISYTKSYLILFYLSVAMLVTLPLVHIFPVIYDIPLSFVLPFWSFINSIVSFMVVKRLFLSVDYEEFTNELFSNIHDAVLITDKDNRIVIINKITDKIISEVIKKDIFFMTPSEIFENYDNKKNYKNKIFKLKGSEYEVMLSQSVMSKKIPGFNSIIVIKDLSTERMLQEELIKSQKLQSISVFVGGVAHDFGNILTAILGNITYLKLKLKEAEPELISVLKENEEIVLQAKNLTKQLLEYTKNNKPLNKSSEDIKEIINSSISLALSGSNILVEKNFEENLERVWGDKGQLEQIFNNLLINARQAIKNNGKISISIKNAVIENKYIQFIKPGKYLEIIVKDNGCGIEKDKLHKIFLPYFTTKSRGNGLGLAIVSSVIKNHNGYISVESEVGKGTKFTIYLPVAAEYNEVITEDEIKENTENENFKNNRKVMIMDDEKMILKISEKLLNHLNYQVVTAEKGEDVLKYLDEHNNEFISIYILDLTIPGGMGGVELVSILKQRTPKSRIIVSSGYANKDEIVNYKKYLFDDKLVKPYTIEDLKRVLRDDR